MSQLKGSFMQVCEEDEFYDDWRAEVEQKLWQMTGDAAARVGFRDPPNGVMYRSGGGEGRGSVMTPPDRRYWVRRSY